MAEERVFNQIYGFSFDDLKSYSNRLHINTLLTLVSNGLAIFLVLKHSTKAMGNYVYYILFTIITALVMDIHITLIYSPYPLFPIPAFCGTGIMRNFGWFWGASFHYTLMHVTLSFAGISIFIGLIYQYFSLGGNASFFHSIKGAIIIFFVTLLFPLPALILYYLARYDHGSFNEEIKIKFPQLLDLVNNAPCDGIPLNSFTIAYLVDAMIQITLVYALFLFFGFKIQKRWSQLKHTMSMNTLRIRRQYLVTLYLQMSVPFIFIVAPTVGLMISVMLKFRNIREISQIAMQIFAFHSCINALTIMIIIKPYKLQLQKYGKTLLFWKKKNVESGNQNFSQKQNYIIDKSWVSTVPS